MRLEIALKVVSTCMQLACPTIAVAVDLSPSRLIHIVTPDSWLCHPVPVATCLQQDHKAAGDWCLSALGAPVLRPHTAHRGCQHGRQTCITDRHRLIPMLTVRRCCVTASKRN